MKDEAVKSATVKPARATTAHADAVPADSALSRRRFVTLVAAGSAALLAAPAGAAERTRTKRSSTPSPKPAPPTPPAPSKFEKELARQRTGTLATLKLVRDFPLPPGGDLPVVFRPQRTRARGR
jgi:hypothetical protein